MSNRKYESLSEWLLERGKGERRSGAIERELISRRPSLPALPRRRSDEFAVERVGPDIARECTDENGRKGRERNAEKQRNRINRGSLHDSRDGFR